MYRERKHNIETCYSVKICSILLINLFMLFAATSNAQETSSYYESLTTENFNPLVDNITDKLPPLEILIDSAIVNSPYVNYEEIEIKLWKHQIKESKIRWMKHLGFDGSVGYGNSYQFYTNQASGSFPSEFSSDRYETRYFIGFYLRVPLFEIINQKNYVKISKREAEKSILKKEQIIKETKQEVIITYEDLVLRQKLLKLINEAQITTSLQVEMAEKEFLNGNIPISELSRLTEIHSKNISEFVRQSSLFYQQYLILEELVGMKFNLLNQIY